MFKRDNGYHQDQPRYCTTGLISCTTESQKHSQIGIMSLQQYTGLRFNSLPAEHQAAFIHLQYYKGFISLSSLDTSIKRMFKLRSSTTILKHTNFNIAILKRILNRHLYTEHKVILKLFFVKSGPRILYLIIQFNLNNWLGQHKYWHQSLADLGVM